MSLEADLQSLLLGAPSVTALVGTRIAADRVEQGMKRPFIVYTRTATERTQGLDGSLHSERATFAVQVWADARLQAQTIADAVTTVIESAHHAVITIESQFDGELDLEAATLSVDWWP